MPPRRRKMKSLKGRVHIVKSQAGWDQLLKKCGKKFLLVHFSAAWCAPCKRMKPVMSDLSRKGEFNSITFAEVDVNQLQAVAEAAGVKTLPTFQVWANGEPLETVTGGTPMKVIELVNKYAGLARTQRAETKSSGIIWKAAAATTLVATGVVAALVHLGVIHLPPQLEVITSKLRRHSSGVTGSSSRPGGKAVDGSDIYNDWDDYVDDFYEADDYDAEPELDDEEFYAQFD
mmetsp:Transcript_9638/g.27576  ORF Transcript_9638/g.27576 Transcript_9638/m.27576 type:complete len:231 (+) Transcript_9638:113-805(+)|eukprot:CAMPEP_0117654896 /NCGR_PEP_ID=MMETSP0804-20121206/3991_1 /TAXON_ID=1074897 /ORGANISM="Tetraselmis astigmatica, Strain CCMP880" /LENGTH=230 /DNA_ID=CAMNT_0005461213 /DNA_START=255 /DNA_END=947 /DNA_ORIENTATION=+